MKVRIKKSTNKKKKLMALFYDDASHRGHGFADARGAHSDNDKKIKTVHFGSYAISDYTKHKDNDRKQRYILRHEKKENFNDYMSAG